MAADIDWPTTLPEFISRQGFNQVDPDNKISSKMAVGPAKTRRRFTSGTTVSSCTLLLSQTEVATFKTFYQSITSSGVSYFNRKEPITEETIEMRFVGTPPKYIPDGAKYRVSFQLEDKL